MNIQAAFKTLLVVAGIGAINGYFEWRQIYGGTPEQRATREIRQCIDEEKSAAYRVHPHMMGRELDTSNKEIEARCKQQALADVPAAAPAAAAGPTYATDVHAQQAKPSQVHRPAKVAPAAARAEPITTRRDKCLERIEEARKRSPGGLNPEWEQDQRNRCEVQ